MASDVRETAPEANSKKTQPPGLYVLFFAELWERFSFYGMRSLLELYMSAPKKPTTIGGGGPGLGYTKTAAHGVFHAYGALVYAFPMLGGLAADKLLGYRLAILLGGLLMAAGHFVMAIPDERAMYLALALLCLGNGFFKPNISSLVGKLYADDDPRRDSGFTIFYMGINVGAWLAPLVCGTIGEKVNWHYGFGLAGVGMLLGLGWFMRGSAKLEGHGEPPDIEALDRPVLLGLSPIRLVLIGTLLVAPLAALLLWKNQIVDYIMHPLSGIFFITLLVLGGMRGKQAFWRLAVAVALMMGSVVFWSLFEQAGSSLTQFTKDHVDRYVFGWQVPTSALLSVNPLYIMLLAIPFSLLWSRLARIDRNPSIPVKFSLGLLQVGAGYLVLVLGASMAGPQAITPMIWILLMYLLHTTGELCLSPIGLSAMTKLAPKDMVGMVMGGWFLASAYALHIGGLIAKLTTGGKAEGAQTALEKLAGYTGVYQDLGYIAMVIAAVMFASSPLLKRGMYGIK